MCYDLSTCCLAKLCLVKLTSRTMFSTFFSRRKNALTFLFCMIYSNLGFATLLCWLPRYLGSYIYGYGANYFLNKQNNAAIPKLLYIIQNRKAKAFYGLRRLNTYSTGQLNQTKFRQTARAQIIAHVQNFKQNTQLHIKITTIKLTWTDKPFHKLLQN